MSPNNRSIVTPRDAAHVLYVMGEGGIQPGSFMTSLIETMARADASNFMRLSMGFPELSAAVFAFQNDEDGVKFLQDRFAEMARS